MIKAGSIHRNIVVKILSESFDSNQSVNFVVKQDAKRSERIRLLMEYSFDRCFAFGEIYLSDDQNACALLLHSECKRNNLKSIWNDIRIAISCIGIAGIRKVVERERAIHRHHPKIPFGHLWYIGVAPARQAAGIGSTMLQEIIHHCTTLEKAIYLETSTLINIPWYKKHGFEIIAILDLTFPLYILKRNCIAQ
ncbi:MAG: GNAT family N-acetyltransferase [Cytophagales bacterium]|nr:GNAT family N-acetyltransferase [Cytophaga sp.]